MRRLIVLNQKGFSLIELIVVFTIIGISAAISGPSWVNSRRQERVNEVFTRIRGALIEAQTNANRMSKTCSITITDTGVRLTNSTTHQGCLLENISFDSSVVSVTSSAGPMPQDIAFTYRGRTSDSQTIEIARKDFSGNVLRATGKCIVISSVGMIRTGVYDASASEKCRNPENDRYDRNP